ncbi:MAG: phosphatase [Candidatus Omnitrophota bacterium]
MDELSVIKEERRKYYKAWREKNKDKIAAINNRFYLKKAQKKKGG